MKKVILVLALFAIAFAFSACSDSTLTGVDQNQTSNTPVPFKGDFEGTAVSMGATYPVPKQLTIDGNATHTGKYSAVMDYFITYNGMPPTGGTIINGDAILTAANGDQIFFENLEGDWWFTSLTDISFTMGGDIVGGTGRFLNATGYYDVTGTQIYDPYNDPTPTFGDWTGSIQY